MAIPVSTAPAARSFLLTAIQNVVSAGDNPTDNPALVRLGEVGPYKPNDIIVIGNVRRDVATQNFVGSGGQYWLRETYEIDVEINTWLASGDTDGADSTTALAVDARGWQLLGYVETAVRNDPSLGGLVEIARPLTTTATGPIWTLPPSDVGLMLGLTLPIRCEVTL